MLPYLMVNKDYYLNTIPCVISSAQKGYISLIFWCFMSSINLHTYWSAFCL